MKVLAKSAARGDVLLRRGVSSRFGARWSQDRLDGRGYVPKDISGWRGRLRMWFAGEVVYEADCRTTENGLCWAELGAGAFDGPEWDTRTSGEFAIDAESPDGSRVERVAEGYWTLI